VFAAGTSVSTGSEGAANAPATHAELTAIVAPAKSAVTRRIRFTSASFSGRDPGRLRLHVGGDPKKPHQSVG